MQDKHTSWFHLYLNSIYVKLILVIFAVLVPIMGLLIGSNHYAIYTIRRQISDSYQRENDFYTQILDNSLSEIELYLSNIMVNNSDFEILQCTEQNTDNYTLSYIRFHNNVEKDLSLYPLIDTFFYYDADNDFFSTISSSPEDYYVKEIVHNDMKNVAFNADYADAFLCWTPICLDDVPYFFRIFTSQNRYIGVWINASKLLKAYELQDLGTDTVSAYIDTNGLPIVADGALPEEAFDISSLIIGSPSHDNYNDYIITGSNSSSGDFLLVSMIPNHVILRHLPVLSNVFRILSLLLLIALPLSTLMLYRIFKKPFVTMTSSMHRIQNGDLEERICTDHMSDEFRTISCIFNEMMDHIHHLKIKLYEDEINRQNETLLYLQMQVKPHFYLNSLNLIYTLARNNNIDLIKDLTMSLIRYFRYMFQESTFASLSAELEHIQNYLRIQELRIPGSFYYDIDMDPSLAQVSVPYLLLQNFAENTIKYAVTLDEPTEFKIKIHKNGNDTFTIYIEDTGPGFSPDMLSSIRAGRIITGDDRKHLGLWNCRRRMELLYHDTASIEFHNKMPHGACITITLPVIPPVHSDNIILSKGNNYESAIC